MSNPTTIIWTDPTTNVDGSPITTGEITGYNVGVRPSANAAGTYPYQVQAPATSTTELLSALSGLLIPGSYFAAVQTVAGATTSVWSNEASFTIAAPAPVPNPPTAVSVS